MDIIAMDCHKRYSLAHVQTSDGQCVREQRIEHRRGNIRTFLSAYPAGSPVAIETLGNWYWIVDEIEAAGMVPRLVHARKAKRMLGSINKTDKLDVRGLNMLQRIGPCRRSGFRRRSCATGESCRGPAWFWGPGEPA